MPAQDTYHEAVKNALIKDGWTIIHDPYKLRRIYIATVGQASCLYYGCPPLLPKCNLSAS